MKILLLLVIFGLCACTNTNVNKDTGEYQYDLNKPPKYYIDPNGDTKTIYEYYKNNIMPEKLRNFFYASGESIDDSKIGENIIEWAKHEAYINLFKYLFTENNIDFSKCPVTDNFKEKFARGVYKYFELQNEIILCSIDEDKNLIELEENNKKKFFNYKLDENGNVDDISLEKNN